MSSKTDSTGSRAPARSALGVSSADQLKHTTCYMCACRCGIRVHLKDGHIRYIEGNRNHPVNKGVLCAIRESDPRKLAFFTGRDQSQALTGWWASQFGTPNYAAHGGFCSVNMAAAGIYTIGGSFWEFGEPDWAHTRYFMMFGVAEDHDSNPIKAGLAKLKARGARVVSVNPVRTGYAAIADDWLPIT